MDTSVLTAYFEREDARSIQLINDVLDGRATAAISLLTVTELWANPRMFDLSVIRDRINVATLMELVGLDYPLARRAGELRRTINLQLADAVIAASAERTGGRFLTKDAHFGRLLRDSVLTGEIYP